MSAVHSVAISDAAGGWCGGLREKGEQSIESIQLKVMVITLFNCQ